MELAIVNALEQHVREGRGSIRTRTKNRSNELLQATIKLIELAGDEKLFFDKNQYFASAVYFLIEDAKKHNLLNDFSSALTAVKDLCYNIRETGTYWRDQEKNAVSFIFDNTMAGPSIRCNQVSKIAKGYKELTGKDLSHEVDFPSWKSDTWKSNASANGEGTLEMAEYILKYALRFSHNTNPNQYKYAKEQVAEIVAKFPQLDSSPLTAEDSLHISMFGTREPAQSAKSGPFDNVSHEYSGKLGKASSSTADAIASGLHDFDLPKSSTGSSTISSDIFTTDTKK